MQRTTLYLITSGIAACMVSLFYFVLLQFLFIPFYVAVIVILLGVVALFWFAKQQASQFRDDDFRMILPVLIVLFIFLSTISTKTISIAERYGEWDAWAIWNLQAKFLTYPQQWKSMLQYTKFGHPDYPLLVPGVTSFFTRLLGNARIEVVSFAFSFWLAILIPIVLFMQTLRKSLLLAILLLWLFATDNFYITRGASMYADTALAFFFLAALIGVRQQENRYLWHWVAGMCLGCCLWTKNEGIILSLIFLVFYVRQFYSQQLLKPILLGVVVPLIVLVFFKVVYAPPNDMMAGQSINTFKQIFDTSRYNMIYQSFVGNINMKFKATKIIVLLYLGFHLFKRKMPDKQFLLVSTCVLTYFMIYVLSVQDLEWHLSTSADRLLHQLMPAMLYALLSIYPEPKPTIAPDQQWSMPM